MSLIQVVITDKFILAGADTRATNCDGMIASETVNKLVKLNKGIIFGCTGGTQDNYKLFYDYCLYNNEIGYSNISEEFSLSYNEFVEIISERFNFMRQIHDDPSYNIRYDIGSFIAGHNGTEFEATCFYLGGEYGMPDGILKVKKAIDFPYKGINLGEYEHRDLLHRLVGVEYHKYRENITISQYKDMMQKVFDKGVLFDATINNRIHFEKIEDRDILQNS